MPRKKKIAASKNTLRLYDRLWAVAEKLGRGHGKTAGIEAALAHFEQASESGTCPICSKSFADCEYFRGLDND